MAELIEMPFGLWACMGPINHGLDRGPEVLRDVAIATNFGMQFATTGFVWTMSTRWLVMEGVWVVSWQNADTADNLQLKDVAMAIIFGRPFVKWFALCHRTVVCLSVL